MLNKKILGIAIAAAMTSGVANATINLDSGAGKVSFATEALLTTATQTANASNENGTSGTYYEVDDSGVAGTLDLTSTSGVGVAINDEIWIRYDFTNAVIETALAAGDLAIGASNTGSAITKGGAAGDDFVIFTDVIDTANLTIADNVVLTLDDLAIGLGASSDITVSIYEAASDATNKTNALVTKTLTGAVSSASGLSTTVTNDDVTADVEESFAKFVASSSAGATTLLGAVGRVETAADTTLKLPNGNAVAAVTDLTANTGNVTFTGDFSVGTWAVFANTNCTGATTALTLNTAKTEGTVTVAQSLASPTLCVTLASNNTTQVNKGDYEVGFDFAGLASTANNPAAFAGTVGSVEHNGTTVQAPYLTTFEDYNQRVILVNRGSSAVAYSTTFTTEDGVTAVAGTAASGTLAANSKTVVKVTDLVSLTGGTRTAATMNIVSPSANISAATTQVNLSDASTDTIVLK